LLGGEAERELSGAMRHGRAERARAEQPACNLERPLPHATHPHPLPKASVNVRAALHQRQLEQERADEGGARGHEGKVEPEEGASDHAE
jgi:hypothetical protein